MKYKIITDDQVAELDALWPEHGEAIATGIYEGIEAYKLGERKAVLFGAACGCVVLAVKYIGKRLIDKRKNDYDDNQKVNEA